MRLLSQVMGSFVQHVNEEAVIGASAAVPLRNVPTQLFNAIGNFAAGAEQYDDMTVVAIQAG